MRSKNVFLQVGRGPLLAYNEMFSAFLIVENPARNMADLNRFISY